MAGTLALTAGLYEWRTGTAGSARPSMNGVEGLPDCPAHARADFVAVSALQCWFYDAGGAWRIRERISAHHALVLHAEVTSEGVTMPMADALVRNVEGRYGEILIYATSRPVGDEEAAARTVTRVQWTPRGGFTMLAFAAPRGR
jgi:hypothetical protein